MSIVKLVGTCSMYELYSIASENIKDLRKPIIELWFFNAFKSLPKNKCIIYNSNKKLNFFERKRLGCKLLQTYTGYLGYNVYTYSWKF